MVQSNKILTVSYGTFSCTLEGFDDSFGTMKAIAEYFRDLASEDRYFGAEPPQPDAEMLAHIAQQEISRRVEAHRDEAGIVLRAQEAAPAAATALVAETPSAAEASTADAVEETVAAASVEEIASEAEAAPVAQVEADVNAAPEETVTEDAPGEDITEEAAAFFANSAEAEPERPVVAEDVPSPAPTTPAEDSIAAKLQRIRAVVSKGGTQQAQGFSEDEHAESFISEEAQAAAEDAVTDSQMDEVSEEYEDQDGLYAHLDQLDRLDDGLEADQNETAAIEAATTDVSEVETNNVAAILADMAAQDTPSDTDAEAPAEDEAVVADPAEPDEVAETGAEPEVEAPAPKAQARVVKVSREEFDAILAADRGEELPQAAAATDMDAGDSTLSAEDEADLMRELAEVEAEMKGETPAQEIAAASDEVEEPQATATDDMLIAETQTEDDQVEDDDIDSIFSDSIDAVLEEDDQDDFAEERAILSGDAEADADVSRIMDEADDKLSDPETSDRRAEFAHLRAAMAAGKAEEAAGGSISEETSDDPYREDLARVVRPRRPEASETRERSRRPQDQKPAPLKLVAAQRVDAPAAPVQPRRVMSTPVAEEDTGKMKFTEYADSVGAVELPDLLEAAAAYLSFVEGQDQFSRPQLMTKVRMVEKEQFSREDGLRSFGLLLRDGKIEKTQAGRFTVSDRIGFRPEDMRAAG